MNDLTRDVVEVVALARRAQAKRNDEIFYWHVESEYWLRTLIFIGIDLKQYLLDVFKIEHPEAFDRDGFLEYMEYDKVISDQVEKLIYDFVDRHEEWQLQDYGDYPVEYIERIEKADEEAKEEARRRRSAGVTQDQPFLL